jgi:hypothetical protein
LFKEKHASKCEELDVLRVEVAELKSRSSFLGACTSFPILHAKIDEMHAYTSSLEAKLKEPIPTSCSTCEMHALKGGKFGFHAREESRFVSGGRGSSG